MRRREALARGVGVCSFLALAGCDAVRPDGEPPRTTSVECDDRGPARTPFDRSLLPLRAGECVRPRLRFVSVAPGALVGNPLFTPVLHPLSQFARTLSVPLATVDRASYLRVPGNGFLQSAAFRTDVGGDVFRTRLRLSNHYVDEAKPYRGFNVSTSPTNAVGTFGTNESWLAVAPASSAGVDLESRTRLERTVDALAGDVSDYPCAYADVRRLLDRVPRTDLVRTEFRVAPGTVDGDDRLPPDSRAGAFYATVRETTREHTALDLAFAAVYPGNAMERAAFEEHVRTHRSTDGNANLGFDDPSFERAGRVVTATESRTIRRAR